MLTPGQRINDRYELICPVGDGGMAHVWAAKQVGAHGFEKLLAIKIIHSRFAEDRAFRTMFLDEARIVEAIAHRNVAQVFDLGETPSGPLLYLVMEYVDGDSLFSIIAPQKTLPVPVALRIAADTCAGLAAVHALVDANGQSRNVVHRDISPQNLLLNMDGETKIIDFGIAHARDRASATTDVGTIKGKVRYMAPEQARRETLGPYTDVFAVGAVLFRMLAGRAPYAAANDIATMQALLANSPPLAQLPQSVPSRVQAIVHRAIALAPVDRYGSAKEMQVALEAAIKDTPPDMRAFMEANISEKARARRVELAARRSGQAPSPPAPALTPDLPGPTLRPMAQTAPQGSVGLIEGYESKPNYQPDTKPLPHPEEASANVAAVVPLLPGIQDVNKDPHAAEPPERMEPKQPSFMDVQALMARARAGGASTSDRKDGESNTTTAREEIVGDDGSVQPKYVGPATRGVGERDRTPMSAAIKGALGAVLLVLVVGGLLLLLPSIARDRAVATAREAGFDIKVERVGIGFDGVTLKNVTVKVPRTPGISATVQEVKTSSMFGVGKDLRIQGVDAKLKGDQTDLRVGLAALLADNRARLAGTASSPRHFSIVGARVTWDGIMGEGSKVEAGEIGAEIDSRGPGQEETRGSVGRFEIKTKQTTLGPWSTSFETGAASSRIRLMFDPPVPDGPSLVYVWGRAGVPPEATLRIPRSPFANLGVRPSELGLPADAGTEIEAKVEAKIPTTGEGSGGKVEAKIDLGLFGLRPPSLKGPIDVKIEGNMSGVPGKPLDLDKTLVTLGPFQAGVNGTLALHERGVGARLDAMFRLIPIACEKIAKAEAKNMGPLVQTLQALGQTTGALRVYGTVNASGVIKYDTAEPEEASITWLAKETCGVSLFGQ